MISIGVSGGGLCASELNRECRYRIFGELVGCSRVDGEVDRPAIDVCSLAVSNHYPASEMRAKLAGDGIVPGVGRTIL